MGANDDEDERDIREWLVLYLNATQGQAEGAQDPPAIPDAIRAALDRARRTALERARAAADGAKTTECEPTR